MPLSTLVWIVRLYPTTILLAFILSLRRAPRQDRGVRILSLLLGLTFTAEVLALVFSRVRRNNMPVYHIFNIVEFLLLCLYFNRSIDVFRKSNMGVYIGIGGIVAGISNVLFLQPIDHFNSYFLLFEGIAVISLALFSFARLMLVNYEEGLEPIYLNPHFWIAAALTFFWSVTFLNWGFHDFMQAKYPDKIWIAHLSVIIANVITYGAMGVVFVFFPKPKGS